MSTHGRADWSDVGWNDWTDLGLIRARLDAGADPHSGVWNYAGPLSAAAELGSPEVVAEVARRVDDVDAEHEGRTALWQAVFANRPGNARALFAAGADPWRPMMAGWSPGRLSLAGPTPGLFTRPAGEIGLSAAEAAAVAEAGRLITALGDSDEEDLSLACVAGIGAAEAVRRLEAVPAENEDDDNAADVVGVTDVPGGCVVIQPWAWAAADPGVVERLSVGTVCYAMYANPKSGDQGSVTRDGTVEEWDTHPGGGTVSQEDSAEDILTEYLYQGRPVAYCCAAAGLRPTDARAVTGPPGMWVRLPDQDWWQ
ncbi:ankyrin repeat domain-containing protein [Sphaerisporangium sp. TRM90804]|uniref:ankyrin repeat domain-containing protein n=1 Tax=Sphaerisporangium sp. TRM90804 TaxID=3031113 RepID=UPI00244A3F19|nr:ankyrin repeat domain-containing protein [Sphaerisporangium sp. TRM90804]MDH2429374.1 ankyrin repeat domain-containing protein [Sphaerisporangium sp. TRM90804]